MSFNNAQNPNNNLGSLYNFGNNNIPTRNNNKKRTRDNNKRPPIKRTRVNIRTVNLIKKSEKLNKEINNINRQLEKQLRNKYPKMNINKIRNIMQKGEYIRYLKNP